jgi:hypothetical protein
MERTTSTGATNTRTTNTLGRVRKLLARAERAGTPEEAQACTDKAVELMARHGIDMALLSAAEPGLDEVGATRMEVADPYSAGKARLLGWTASALRCRAVLHQLGGGRVGAVTVFGFASDRERVEVLFTSLLLQAGAQLLRERPPHPGESVAAYRRSWLHGFAVQVHRRLVDAERRAEQQAEERSGAAGGGAGSPGAALVLADRRSQVERAYAEAFPALGRSRRSVLSGTGFVAGAAAGERADLGAGALRGRRALGA